MPSLTETHVAIWGGWYGSRNVGDRALLLTIAPMLKTVFSSVRMSVFTNKPEIVMEYAPQEPGLIVDAFENRRQFHRLVQTLASCDLFIIGGGVPFYDQKYHLWVMRLLVSLAKLFKTPYMTWAVSSQRIESREAKRVFKWVLDGAAGVTFRDRPTGEMFRDCGTNRPMTLVADPAFTISIDESGAGDEVIRQAIGLRVHSRPLTALVCRRLRHDHSYSSDHYNSKTSKMVDHVIQCFASALDWMWENGYQPIVVPMNTVEPDDDREMGKLVIQAAQHGGDALLVDQSINPFVAAAVFRQCRFGLSSRLHASVLATVANCPMVIYCIGPKLHGVAEAMGTQGFAIDEERVTPNGTRKALRRMEKSVEEVKEALANRLPELQEQALIPASLAREIVEQRSLRGKTLEAT